MKVDPQIEKEVLIALQRLKEAFQTRNVKAALESFVADEGVVIVGSEAGETAEGVEQLRTYFEKVLSGPITYDFQWEKCDVNSIGDVAWLFANGRMETTSAAGHHRHPYRITGVLCRRGSEWMWAQYHGSEPAG